MSDQKLSIIFQLHYFIKLAHKLILNISIFVNVLQYLVSPLKLKVRTTQYKMGTIKDLKVIKKWFDPSD